MLILFAMCAVNVFIAKENTFNEDYLSVTKTNAVKGIFVIIVFFRHFNQYVDLNGIYDQAFLKFNGYIGQLLVAMFLFYSGYGVMESIKKKGEIYVKSIPTKRALKVLIHFDIAIILFLLLNWMLGNTVSVKQFLLALTGWESIGNSNWYVLAILITYIITFFAFVISKKRWYMGAFLTTVLSVCTILILQHWKDGYYYNTLLCYTLGIWWSLLHNRFEKVIMKNDITYFGTLMLLFAMYYISYTRRNNGIWQYELWALVFTLLVLLVTMKVCFDNGFIQFLGNHTFSLYILQRIPMWYLSRTVNCQAHPYVFFLLSFLATIVIALIYDWVVGKLDKMLFKK